MEIKSRIQQKHDIELNWKKAINFIPKQGEIIVYDKDESFSYERFKIGDGETKVNDLPFLQFSAKEKENLLNEVKTYTEEKIAAETTAREAGDAKTLTDAKAYTDEAVAKDAKVSYETVQTLTDTQKDTARTNIGLQKTSDAEFNSVAINYFVMKDAITGCEYFVTIENGVITYNSKLLSIEISKMPSKMIFYRDETLEDFGIEIIARYEDGTVEVITDYTYEMSIGDTSVDISYNRNGVTYTVTLSGISVKEEEQFVDCLIDFEYTDNGDGTYTLTDWKGTYNGIASNRIIVPNDERIKL